MEEIVVKQSAAKQMIMLILGLVMIGACVFIFAIADTATLTGPLRFLNSPSGRLFIKCVGIAGILFFALCLVFIIKRLVVPKDLLIINKYGVTDHSSAAGVGLIEWQDIKNIFITEISGIKFISIDVGDDIDKYLKNISPLKAKSIKLNMSMGYPPISINLQTANCKIEEVLNVMQKHFEFYRYSFCGKHRS